MSSPVIDFSYCGFSEGAMIGVGLSTTERTHVTRLPNHLPRHVVGSGARAGPRKPAPTGMWLMPSPCQTGKGIDTSRVPSS